MNMIKVVFLFLCLGTINCAIEEGPCLEGWTSLCVTTRPPGGTCEALNPSSTFVEATQQCEYESPDGCELSWSRYCFVDIPDREFWSQDFCDLLQLPSVGFVQLTGPERGQCRYAAGLGDDTNAWGGGSFP